MSMYPIASTTLGSAGSISFSLIPQTFTHLQARLFVREASTSGSSGVTWWWNSQPSGIAAYHLVQGDGSSATSTSAVSASNLICNGIPGTSATSGIYSCFIIDILDYTNTSKNKTAKIMGGYDANGSGVVSLQSGLIQSTSAVSSLYFQSYYSNLAAGSRIDLYGITTSNVTGA